MRQMWQATVGDLFAHVDFNDDNCNYTVTVAHNIGTIVKSETFKMTCWTKPFGNAMDVTDLSLSRQMAEKLSVEVDKQIKEESW